jgi:hypothetical protein
MSLPILGEIERLITEHGSAVILKERNALLHDKLVLLKEEVAKLEKENSDLKAKVAALNQQLSSSAATHEFQEERGALFKRRAGGGYHNAVYCPKCHHSTAPFPPGAEFCCDCGWFSSFTERELPGIIASLKT